MLSGLFLAMGLVTEGMLMLSRCFKKYNSSDFLNAHLYQIKQEI